jgi:hypothetical protein
MSPFRKLLFLALPALAAPNVSSATPIQWSGNGHYYEFIEAYISWTDAKAAASARQHLGLQGYLATVTSEAENDWMLANILPSGTYITGVWIGGSQSPNGAEPHGGWGWSVCTGETFSYTNWETVNEPSPDNAGGCEEFIEMHLGSGKWGDAGNGPVPGGLDQTRGYIVEFGGPAGLPCPTSSCVEPCADAPPCSGSLTSQCSDGIDNDGDGCADYPNDHGCTSSSDNSEAEGPCLPTLPIQGGVVTALTGLMMLASGTFLLARRRPAR